LKRAKKAGRLTTSAENAYLDTLILLAGRCSVSVFLQPNQGIVKDNALVLREANTTKTHTSFAVQEPSHPTTISRSVSEPGSGVADDPVIRPEVCSAYPPSAMAYSGYEPLVVSTAHNETSVCDDPYRWLGNDIHSSDSRQTIKRFSTTGATNGLVETDERVARLESLDRLPEKTRGEDA